MNAIQYIFYKNIDKQKWDDCISLSSNGLVFGYSWFLDATCEEWDALVLNDYEAVFPVTLKSKMKVFYLFNPIFALQLGIFSKREIVPDLVQQFLRLLPDKIKLIDINLNYGIKYTGNEYKVTEKKCQEIALNSSYESIVKNYSTNLKRNLAKAAKNHLKIREASDIKNVVKLFKESRGKELKEISARHYDRLGSLLEKMKMNKMLKIYECYSDSELMASAAFSFSNNRIIYIKGGSSANGKKLGAMSQIMDHVIKTNAGSGLTYDFGGSSIPAVARFNGNFGAVDYCYQRLYKNNLPFLLKLLKK